MRAFPLVLATVVLAGCTTAAGPTPVPSPSAPPSPGAPPSPSPSPASFTIDVIPPEDPPEVRTAIPGQGVCFLVIVTDEAVPPSPVTIAATASGATIRGIEPRQLAAGTVGEVWVVPDATAVETAARVAITATARPHPTVERSLPVFPMADERAADARPYFDRWLAWLIAERTELGITEATSWTPEFVSTLLVVSHYAYWSEDWEATILWHNMIPPYDWTEIQLRHRWTEAADLAAAWTRRATTPHEVEPPEVGCAEPRSQPCHQAYLAC
jgi:hypothetical protein